MKNFAQKFLDWYNSLDKVVRAVLCLLWDIPSNLYRFSKSALKDSTLGVVLAIVLAIFGGWILFVVDLVCILLKDRVLWLEDLNLENLGNAGNEETPAQDDAQDQPQEAKNGEVED